MSSSAAVRPAYGVAVVAAVFAVDTGRRRGLLSRVQDGTSGHIGTSPIPGNHGRRSGSAVELRIRLRGKGKFREGWRHRPPGNCGVREFGRDAEQHRGTADAGDN